MKTGIVVLGHGSRSSVGEANQAILDIAAQVRKMLGATVLEVAFMNRKSLKQSLIDAIGKVVEQGVDRIVIAPLFITRGMHMVKDIPEEIEMAKEKYKNVEFIFAGHMGPDYRIAQIVTERVREVFPAL
ncbi:MAG: cobalamin biosynthesis protein CbiX [Peptococcaceae bacterium]|nr:MAG: cobalamin biosynthesis protein CbiX [Peptococcaceae bacterium]